MNLEAAETAHTLGFALEALRRNEETHARDVACLRRLRPIGGAAALALLHDQCRLVGDQCRDRARLIRLCRAQIERRAAAIRARDAAIRQRLAALGRGW